MAYCQNHSLRILVVDMARAMKESLSGQKIGQPSIRSHRQSKQFSQSPQIQTAFVTLKNRLVS
jgi:hypothetical protein